MNDTLDTNLPVEESGKLDETKATEIVPETSAEEVTTESKASDAADNETTAKMSKEDVLAKLKALVENPENASRNDVDSLKQAYYKIRKSEVEELKKSFIEEGGVEDDFVAPEDEAETAFKELLAEYKTKRASIIAEEEQAKAANYALKLQLIERLKELTESQDDFNKLYNEFKDIQQRWKEVKHVPQELANELWKSYQTYSEKFYDIIKINNQFRDYDFKKNLELKIALCETVEKLQEETDVISAFHQLQKLHQQWREIGPVAKELREEIWGRFKAASTLINKNHQDHFEKLKAKEQGNLEEKTAICEQLESIDFESLKTFKDWEEKNKEVIGLQGKWKTIGFAPKKYNVKIFERFRFACDEYFKRKGEFYKEIKGEIEKNLELKNALCEKAEALKDNQDWRVTTDKMIALQKEWKTIGPVSRKYSDTVWKRFITACDYFFEQKNKNTSSQKSVEQENLVLKKDVVAKIGSIEETLSYDETIAALKALMTEWSGIGFVPFKEKDKIYKEYQEAVDKVYDRLNVDKNDRRMQSFRENITDIAGQGKGKLYNERDRLMRTYDRMKNELQTYENNMGFFNVSSKGGGGLLKDMERKIEKLKSDMELVVKKIDTIDENL